MAWQFPLVFRYNFEGSRKGNLGTLPRHCSRILLALGSAFWLACGSAVEVTTPSLQQPASDKTVVLAEYVVSVDPLNTEINFTPQPMSGPSALGALLQTLTASDISISGGSTSTFDDSSNKIRLSGVNNKGLCVQNIRSSGHLIGLQAKMFLFSSNSVTPGEGAASDGQGNYIISYGDVANGATTCRPFSLTNTSAVTYRFNMIFEATISGSAPASYISNVNTTQWLAGDAIQINGANLSTGSGSQICLTSNPSEVPFCNSGTILSPAVLSQDPGGTFLTFYTSGLPVIQGYIVVKNTGGTLIQGPYVNWTSVVRTNLALPSGSNTTSVFYRTWSDVGAGVDANGCPSTGSFEDTERVNNVSLSTSGSNVDMNFLSTAGGNKNVYVAVDVDHSGTLNAGDYYALIPHADLAINALTQPANFLGASSSESLFDAAGGSGHVCAITAGNQAYCWGSNLAGQVGNGTSGSNLNTPQAVSNMTSGVTAISAAGAGGLAQTCAIKDGAAYCWGDNSSGQLGIGNTSGPYNTPQAVSNMTSGVSAIQTAYQFSCGVKNGAVYCWGDNSSGKLGIGTTGGSYNSPQAISSLSSGVTSISLGASHGCAVKNGAAYCWGYNGDGRLGDGTTTDRNAPVAVSGFSSNVSSIDAGLQGTCAIKSGSAYCWGNNSYGQIGDGTTGGTHTTPTQVTSLTSNVTAISTGWDHTCAIQNGGAYCWGAGAAGQIGDGNGTDRTLPGPVSGFGSGVTTINASLKVSCATRNGASYCWGRTSTGQFGNGSDNSSSTTPTATSGGLSFPSLNITFGNTITATCP